MKKIKKIRERIVLHPIMSFLILILITICISGVLSLFDITGSYSSINTKTYTLESTMVAIENLFSLRGLKYIFSNTVSNFATFTPLIMLLITLLGIGIMDKTGLRAWKIKNSIKMMESDMPADSVRRVKIKAEREISGGYC